jgi:hypothetical protein
MLNETFISEKVNVLADFFGFLTPAIEAEVAKFPPTIILHNEKDQIVLISNSEKLDQLPPSATAHQFVPYVEYWQEVNHAFKPGDTADVDSRAKTMDWFVKHLSPISK